MSEFELVPIGENPKGHVKAYVENGKIVLMMLDSPEKIEELAKKLSKDGVTLVNAVFVFEKTKKDPPISP
jgi:hypothetical protein